MTTLRRGDQIFGTGSALQVSDVIIGVADEAEIAVPNNALLDDDGEPLLDDDGSFLLDA